MGTEEPWCEACIEHSERTWPFALPIMAISCTAVALGTVRQVYWIERWAEFDGVLSGVAISLLCALTWYSLTIAQRKRHTRAFVPRDLESRRPPTEHRGSYRDAVRRRRVVDASLPPLSADETLLTAVGALLVLGVLAMVSLEGWPLWLRLEAIVGALAALVMGTVTWVVYRGHAVADDMVELPPRKGPEGEALPHHLLAFIVALFAPTGPGVLAIVALSIPLFVALGAMWALAFAFPLAYWLTYHVLGGGLVRVSRRHRHKAGDLRASLVVGVVAGLLVSLPLAGLVGFGHWAALQL